MPDATTHEEVSLESYLEEFNASLEEKEETSEAPGPSEENGDSAKSDESDTTPAASPEADERSRLKELGYTDEQIGAALEDAKENDNDALEKVMAQDLEEIKAALPQYAPESLSEIDNLHEFARMRVHGISPVTAFKMTNRARIDKIDGYVKKASTDRKGHLTSALPSEKHAPPGEISDKDLRMMSELYGGSVSEKDLRKYYRKVTT